MKREKESDYFSMGNNPSNCPGKLYLNICGKIVYVSYVDLDNNKHTYLHKTSDRSDYAPEYEHRFTLLFLKQIKFDQSILCFDISSLLLIVNCQTKAAMKLLVSVSAHMWPGTADHWPIRGRYCDWWPMRSGDSWPEEGGSGLVSTQALVTEHWSLWGRKKWSPVWVWISQDINGTDQVICDQWYI